MRRLVPIVVNQFGAFVFGIIGIKLLSWLVPPAINGVYQVYFLTLAQIAVQITHPGLINFTSRYWQRERSQASQFVRFLWVRSWINLQLLAPLLGVLVAAVALGLGDLQWLWCLPMLVLANWVIALNAAATLALNADERHWAICALNSTAAATRALLPLALAYALGATFLVLGLGFALHALLLGACVLWLFRAAWRASPPSTDANRQWLQQLRRYGRPFAWLGLGGWLLQFADRWAVALFFGEDQAGLFALASNLGGYVPTLALAGLMQGVFPAVFRQADAATTADDWRRLARHCDAFTLVFLALAVGGLACLHGVAPHLVGWLIDARYERSLVMIFAGGLAMVTSQVNQFQYLLLQGQHNSAAMVRVMLTLAGIKTAGSLVAAAISWPAFLWWLVISMPVSAWLGRHLIRKVALRGPLPRHEGDI